MKEVLEADEVFLTSTTSEVTPIVEIDNEKVNDGQPGPITKKLLEQYDQYLHVERLD